MSIDQPGSNPSATWPARPARRIRPLAIVILAVAGVGLVAFNVFRHNPHQLPALTPAVVADEPRGGRMAAPELEGGVAWLNTAGPVHLKDLRGKIVILDFWTLCCINCIHTLPDLAKLEKKYPNEVVVIGVHSPKFDNEHATESIRKAVLRYEVKHPVVNDANQTIWKAYDAQSW